MKIFVIIIGCIVPIFSHAQGICGRIIDELSQPIAFANVVLLNRSDSTFIHGVVTKDDGTFTIQTDCNDGLLKIFGICYVTKYINVRQGNVGDILMQLDHQMLGEVVVKGNVPAYRQTSEGILVNVTNSIFSKLGTADDVLKHVPSIIKKSDCYEVFGKGVPLIYINGRLMRNAKELDQLKSTDIEYIELVTNPGSKYDATVGAVVKIRTVRKAGDGLSIDTWGRWQQSRKDKEAVSLDLNYRHNRLDVFASIWGSKGKHLQLAEITQEVQTEMLWQQQNELRTDIISRDYSIEVGLNYQLNDNRTFGAKYEFSFPIDEDVTTALTSDVITNGQLYDRWKNLTNKQTNCNSGHKINAYYSGKVGKLGIDWNFDYLHNGDNEQSKIEETCQMQENRLIDAENKVRNNMFASKLAMTYSFFDCSLDFGAEYINTSRQDDYVNSQNYVASSYSTLKEQSISLYAEYSKMFPKIGMLRAGLRYEHVKFDYYESGNLMEGQSRSYGNFYQSLSLVKRFGDVHTLIAYSAKTTRPTYRQLSNDVFYGNRYSLSRGNPLLDNSIRHALSFQGMWKFLQISLSYSDERNAIIHWMELVDQAGVTMVTYKNINSLKSFTPFISIAPTLGIWHPQFSFGIRKQWLTLETTSGSMSLNKPMVLAQANNTFAFSSTLTGELNFSYQSPGHYQNIYFDYHQTVLNVCLVKTFFDDCLSIKIAGEDLLNRNRDGNLCYNHQVKLWQGNFYDRRRFVATIRYNLNSTRSKYKGSGAGNEEKNRLK